MREIKFREWHQNHMRYWDDIGFFHLYILNDGKGIFEQYTGRVDAHDTKIFEGDIVQLNHDGYDWFGYQESIAITDKVMFDAGAFWIGDEPIYTYLSEDMQVIGNIHENPELLEAE